MVCITALIVTFNPDKRLFLSLENVQKIVNRLVIVDNDSSDKSFIGRIKSSFNENFFTILELPRNLGIAGALNYGVEHIKFNLQVDYILTLDQDTIIVQHEIDTVIRNANQRFDRIGIIALGMNKSEKTVNYREIKYVITSGNLVRIDVFNKLKFREEFFMDQVDFDFDYEVRKLGYRIVLADGYLIDHILGIKLGKLAYEPLFRVYYIIRNSTVLLIERKISIIIYASQIARWSISSILHDGIFKYFRTLITGVTDGLSKKLGKR
jgi:rhamnosyltransferase